MVGTCTTTTFSGALNGNATTATALTSGKKTVSGNLTVAGLVNIHNKSPYAVAKFNWYGYG
jgi:hypothetical protein